MTCHDARELFSALIDERLSREERADVYGHLATCPECRRELTALEQTVALVRRSAPARAPSGFVDRVVGTVRPTPWYIRAARAAFQPWPVKLPLEAAAVLLVAGLAVLLFRGTQEQQQAARTEAPPPVIADRSLQDKRTDADESAAKGAENKVAEPATPSAVPPATAPRRADDEGAAESSLERRQVPAAPAERDTLGKETYTGTRAAPPVAQSAPESREKSVLAKVEGPRPADVVAQLTAPDPSTAARAVSALATRLAGAETGRRSEGDTLVLELVVPRARYTDFTREVARLGDYRTDAEPATLPEAVRVAVRLTR